MILAKNKDIQKMKLKHMQTENRNKNFVILMLLTMGISKPLFRLCNDTNFGILLVSAIWRMRA